MRIVKYFINTILSFFIVLVVLVIIAMNILNSVILDKNYMLSKMDETEFNLQISREVESGFENYIYQSGLPEDTIKNLFTEEMIEKDVNTIVNAIYDGTEITLSSDELRKNLDIKIEEYIKNENLKLNEQGRNNIKEFEDLIVEEYDNNINVSSDLYTSGNEIIEQLKNVSDRIGNIPQIILVILIVILVLLNITDVLIAINFLGIALLAVGILLKLATNVVFTNVDIDNLVLLTTSLSNLIISIVKDNIYKLSDLGIMFIVCGITAILCSIIIKNVKNRKAVEN